MKHKRILLTSIFLAIFSLCANAANHPTPPVIDVVIEPIHVNDDDDSAAGANEVVDFNEVDTDSGELSKVTITLKKLLDQESVDKFGSGKLKAVITGKDYVRIWKNADRSEMITLSDNTIFDKNVSLGMTQDYVETFYVEGIKHTNTKEDVIIEAGYTVDTAEVAKDTAKTGVWQVDLDVDSENKAIPWNKKDFTRGIDDTADAIEASNKDAHLGKIYITDPQPDVDGDGVPDWADGYGVAGGSNIDKGQFLPVIIELPEPYDVSLAKVQFGYTLSPLLTIVPAQGTAWSMPSAGMRLWKKDATEGRTSTDLIKPDADVEIKWVDLAGSSRKVTLYLEAVTDGVYAGKKELKITVTGDGSVKVEDKAVVNLLPVEVNSLDRYVEGRISLDSLEKIGGIDELSIQVVSKDGSEIHGSFDGLSEAHIYESDDDITSDAEIAEYSGGNLDRKQYDDQSQDMVFWKEDGDLVFATTFDTVGEIKVQFVKDEELLVEFDYTLTAHAEFSELIDSLDEIFAGIPFPGVPPTILAAQQPSVSSLQVQRLGLFKKLFRRNLVTKCASAVFKKVKKHVVRGVVVATKAAIEAVKTNAVFAQGFVQGLWAGIKDDALAVWEGVQLFGSLLTNPVETCASFRRVFNELLGITWEQFKQVPKKLVDQFITDSQENIAWAGPENDLNLIVYIVGYSTGYITEKVGLAILTGGASAAAQGVAQGANFAAKFVKIIQAVRKVTPDRLLKATAIAADAVKAANATKTKLFRRMSQFATDKTGITKLRKHLETVIKACPS
jgi:hypothetical protein